MNRVGMVIVFIVIIMFSAGVIFLTMPNHWFGMIVNPPNFNTIELDLLVVQYFEPSGNVILARFSPQWWSVTTQDAANDLKEMYGIYLPNIDFEKEMLIVSLGSELEHMDYDLNEPIYRRRGAFIGFPVFKQEIPENIIAIYRATRTLLMCTDAAGFPPYYRGRGRNP